MPVVINSFNQLGYLRGMIEQLSTRNVDTIMVIDQCSTDDELNDYLTEIRREVCVVRLRDNHGPHWFFMEGMSSLLPAFFAYTDPDLRFQETMPYEFLRDLQQIADDLDAVKVGLALSIDDPEAMHVLDIEINNKKFTTLEWEAQFWTNPVSHPIAPVFRAPVDTTFAVYRRSAFDRELAHYRSVRVFDVMDTPGSFRVAGDYAVDHLPWMKDDPLPRREWDLYGRDKINIHDY